MADTNISCVYIILALSSVLAAWSIYSPSGLPVQYLLLLTLSAHVQRGLRYLFCMCVCLSVTTFSDTMRNVTTKFVIPAGLLLQQLQFRNGNFHKTATLKSYGMINQVNGLIFSENAINIGLLESQSA